MDHSDVVRLQTAEKYVLGELPPELRDQFEEHYFDCAQCAEDVRSLAAFVSASRAILEERLPSKFPAADPRPRSGPAGAGWFPWLKPMVAVPAMAALAAVVIFQNFVTIPELRHRDAPPASVAVFASSHHLQGVTRGENATPIQIAPGEPFALDFDFTPAVPYQSYTGALVNASGRNILIFRVSAEMANKELHVAFPAGQVEAGRYQLVFMGEEIATGPATSPREVQRIPFSIELRR